MPIWIIDGSLQEGRYHTRAACFDVQLGAGDCTKCSGCHMMLSMRTHVLLLSSLSFIKLFKSGGCWLWYHLQIIGWSAGTAWSLSWRLKTHLIHRLTAAQPNDWNPDVWFGAFSDHWLPWEELFVLFLGCQWMSVSMVQMWVGRVDLAERKDGWASYVRAS